MFANLRLPTRQLDQVAQPKAAFAEQGAAAVESLELQAAGLVTAVRVFKRA